MRWASLWVDEDILVVTFVVLCLLESLNRGWWLMEVSMQLI